MMMAQQFCCEHCVHLTSLVLECQWGNLAESLLSIDYLKVKSWI